ncbi:MAG TPA: hypothetical protein ENI49_00100 [Thermoplasmatales archaeon]|nr:hypothetical protein [Thermoplasmatales archaeon]
MSKEIRSKTLAIFVVLAMVLSTMMVFNTLNFSPVRKASATIGVDEWQNSSSGAKILNMSTENIYYGKTVTVKFNGSLITEDCYIYKPNYNKTGGNYYGNWSLVSGSGLNASLAEPSVSLTLDRAGLWLVVPFDYNSVQKARYLSRVNMSNMSVYDPVDLRWEHIVGWFWVNSSSWTIELSDNKINYDHNDSVTITVKDGDNKVNVACWIDIWVLNGSKSTLVKHYYDDDGYLDISNDIYDLTHDNGAGIYQITAYRDVKPLQTNDAILSVYGDSSQYIGYNSTFGDVNAWSAVFHNHILDSDGNTVDETTWANTTYRYDTCGPFDPPEYWATPVNLTVEAGVPQLSIPDEYATRYWNFTGIVNITVKDYDGNNLTFDKQDVKLYNKSNKPTKSGATPIDSKYYNVSTGPGWIAIEPAYPEIYNYWGYNISTGYVWAQKGKVYVLVANGTMAGNASEEWNGTTYFTLATAPAVQIFMKNYLDKEIPEVPQMSNQPLYLYFQVVNRNHQYLGLSGGQYITISGNALFAEDGKTLDKLDGATYVSANHTWKVPITPTMALNGGTITISVDWPGNGTATETLTVGGTQLNGSIVSISPSEFVIGQNVTLTVTVSGRPNGYPYPNANIGLFYVNDTGKLVGPAIGWYYNNTMGDTNGQYSIFINETQQTTNQTYVDFDGDGVTSDTIISAPRYIAAYVHVTGVGYGYAYTTMKPKGDLKVEMSKDTFMAGQLTDFWVNVSVVDENGNKTGEPDDSGLHVRIYNSTGDDVTDSIGSLSTSDLDGSASIELNSEYFTEPGTYTVCAYNYTHTSNTTSGTYNATFTVIPVTVTCDKNEFIYKYDDNISATFTVTWQGNSVGNGTLRIFNISDATTYNQTWVNYSADPTAYIDVDVVNGIFTMHNITANLLPTNKGVRYITFAYEPEDSTVFANATGSIPVKVPDATPDPSEVALNEPANVKITVTGRGEPLEGVFVSIDGPGNLAMNGTTGADGTITFSFVPTATGDINIKVYNRSTGSKITVTAHTLNIDAPAQANEGETFTVTVKDENGNAVSDAQVTFSGTGETKTTDSSGKVTFTGTVSGTLPYMTYKLTATKAGYKSDEESITIVGVPQLYIEAPATVDAGSTFTVKVTSDTGAVYGVEVTFNGETKTITGPSGVTFTAPSSVTKETPYTITATKDGYKDATATITVKPAGIPGFELITLIAAIGIAFILLRRRH